MKYRTLGRYAALAAAVVLMAASPGAYAQSVGGFSVVKAITFVLNVVAGAAGALGVGMIFYSAFQVWQHGGWIATAQGLAKTGVFLLLIASAAGIVSYFGFSAPAVSASGVF